MNLKIDDPALPVAEADVAEAEARMTSSIPPEYRKFLLKNNGGRPRQPCDFSMRDSSGRNQVGTVDRFLGIDAPEFFNLEHYLQVYQDRIPRNRFPIAYDPGGNLIVISTSSSDAGSVYFWDHELEAEEGQPPTDKNLYFIAGNFDEFLSNLCK